MLILKPKKPKNLKNLKTLQKSKKPRFFPALPRIRSGDTYRIQMREHLFALLLFARCQHCILGWALKFFLYCILLITVLTFDCSRQKLFREAGLVVCTLFQSPPLAATWVASWVLRSCYDSSTLHSRGQIRGDVCLSIMSLSVSTASFLQLLRRLAEPANWFQACLPNAP